MVNNPSVVARLNKCGGRILADAAAEVNFRAQFLLRTAASPESDRAAIALCVNQLRDSLSAMVRCVNTIKTEEL